MASGEGRGLGIIVKAHSRKMRPCCWFSDPARPIRACWKLPAGGKSEDLQPHRPLSILSCLINLVGDDLGGRGSQLEAKGACCLSPLGEKIAGDESGYRPDTPSTRQPRR
ncbi:predicted protein [Histoplasma capsulatum var. duboisii H88]|uniref:Predicted protein n=1 Tax=Ajellomyces capsulatus (strain H88) TaxID=544711 RepID=F0UPE2_AJEC8|nr:predicted protein [Histoplasma capsulatum var. duboisii H88]